MASSSKRLFRSQVKKQRSRNFRTVVYPDNEKIQLCPKFRENWSDALEDRPFGYLMHPSCNTSMLELHIEGRDCYMTCGRMASILYGFKEPVEVIVEYKVNRDNENCFKFREIGEPDLVDLSSEDESLYNVFTDGSFTLHEFCNDRLFGWELNVSEAYASAVKQQVLHIPPRMAASVLKNRDSIVLRTRHELDGITRTIKTYVNENKPEKKHMFLTEGWYEFKKANHLREGDKLLFQLSDPPDVLVVEIVRCCRHQR